MSRYGSTSDRYTDDYFRQYERDSRDRYERPEQTVHTIMDNLSKGGVQPDYASQWAKYYRSQGMNREAEMIEDYVRSKTDREGRSGGASSYGSGVCYRCDKVGHFARECPTFTGVRRETRSRSPRRDSRDLPPSSGGGQECYRCHRHGHMARECPEFTGVRQGGRATSRSPPRSGGGGMGRRVAHPVAGQALGTSECYRCNKVGHFARECPTYTGTPYPNAFRGQSGRGGGGGHGSVRAIEYGSQKCLKCNKYGHFARECREEDNLCYKCHKSGHIAKECTEKEKCFVCNKDDHLARDCPDGNVKTCYRCQGKGHVTHECPSDRKALDRQDEGAGAEAAGGSD